MALQNLSRSVYIGLCLELGTQEQVTSRRETIDIVEPSEYTFLTRIMMAGSRREGFNLPTSDLDLMHWFKNHSVLWNFSQIHFYKTENQIIILCDSSECSPGFTLLWFPLECSGLFLAQACVRINGRLYLSSAQYKNKRYLHRRPEFDVHGPCISESSTGLDTDFALCLSSDFWPPLALPWVDRCHVWPPPCVVDAIVKNGCHFVAISNPVGNHKDNEWRISFSQAEIKLVYAMNHTQFLTYGLLKLVLKEIINSGLSEEEALLCSYHLKTTVFWAIQQNTLQNWCPENLLEGFWICYKLLLKWVYEGICPNFFIPENNMFLSKVHGQAQQNLFNRLCGFYEKGIAFLLESPSIRSHIMNVLDNPTFCLCVQEDTLIPEALFDAEFFQQISFFVHRLTLTCLPLLSTGLSYAEQISRSPQAMQQAIVHFCRTGFVEQYLSDLEEMMQVPSSRFLLLGMINDTRLKDLIPNDISNLQAYVRYIDRVEKLVQSNLTQYQTAALQKLTVYLFIQLAFHRSRCTNTSSANKNVYIADKSARNMLKLAVNFGFISDMLYLAMYFYKTFRFREALSLVEMTKVKLAHTFIVPEHLIDPNEYIWAMGGQSLSQKMKAFPENDLLIFDGYIDELSPELFCCLEQGRCNMYIPLYILLYMLEVLCSRHVDPDQAQEALADLQNLVQYDQGILISPFHRDISWEILGICQQITGNLQAAQESYQQSLVEIPENRIRNATIHRLQELHSSSPHDL